MKEIDLRNILALIFLTLTFISINSLGSTMTAYVYPNKDIAYVVINHYSTLTLSYPSSSWVSKLLNNNSGEIALSEIVNASYNSKAFNEMNSYISGPSLKLINASINYNEVWKANSTTFILIKNETISLYLKGFNVSKSANGTYVNLSWRGIEIPDKLESNYERNYSIDINHYSSTIELNENIKEGIMKVLEIGMPNILNKKIIDFKEFEVPLTKWKVLYDQSKNITILYYSFNENSSVSKVITINKGTYSIKYYEDPSVQILIPGKAIPTQDGVLIINSDSTQQNSFSYTLLGVIGVALISSLVVVALRRVR